MFEQGSKGKWEDLMTKQEGTHKTPAENLSLVKMASVTLHPWQKAGRQNSILIKEAKQKARKGRKGRKGRGEK